MKYLRQNLNNKVHTVQIFDGPEVKTIKRPILFYIVFELGSITTFIVKSLAGSVRVWVGPPDFRAARVELGFARFVFIPPPPERSEMRTGSRGVWVLWCRTGGTGRTGSSEPEAERTWSRNRPGYQRCLSEGSERRGPGEIPSGASQRSRAVVDCWRLQDLI